MGIDGALSDAIEKVPFEHLRFLSRDEIARFRIDRRDFLESRWENLPAQPSTIAKLVVEAKRPNSNAFRTSLIRLVCGGAGKLLVGYIRSFDEAEQLTTIKLAAGQDEIRLQNVGYINEIPVRADGAYVEGTFATIRFFDRAAMANGLEIAPVASSNSEASKQQPVKLSVAGLAESLATLRRSCR